MRQISFLIFLSFAFSCVSLKNEDMIIKEKYLSDDFNYEPNGDEIAIRFIVEKANLIGRLYKQKKHKIQVRKKEIIKFNYDDQGRLLSENNGRYWPQQVFAWIITFGFYIPFTVYDLTSAYFKLGESAEIEATELKPVDSFEFEQNYFQNGAYSVILKGRLGIIEVIDSKFTFPINDLINAKVSNIEYTLYKGEKRLKSDIVPYFSNHITGKSNQFENWSASIVNEKKQIEERRKNWEQNTTLLFSKYLAKSIRYPGFPVCRDDRSIDLKKWEYLSKLDCTYRNPNTGNIMWDSKIYSYDIVIECTQRYHETKMSIYKRLYVNTNDDISEDRFGIKCTKE